MKINSNYSNLQDSYLFATVAKKVSDFKTNYRDKKVISLGIGDVTLPLPKAVIDAMLSATKEMGTKEGFKGYKSDHGYPFLIDAIRSYYLKRNIKLEEDEIFISDGAKSDVGNILDIFSDDNIVLIPDPVYPVYVDTNIMAGRKVTFLDATKENNFTPLPDKNIKADIIYLCSPNNPTGAVYTKEQLKAWVDYALENNSIILFDAAYESYITADSLPKSIFEIEGAKKCAIEFCSLSKTAGFTGTRCGYTVVPFELKFQNASINGMWNRRQGTKFNGVPYIIQKGAEAVFTNEGMAQCKENIKYYLENAKIIGDTLKKMGVWFIGGTNSPYIWLKCKEGMTSWEYFDYLLNNANVVGTPGSGFGSNGEGYFRLTAFGNREDVIEAMKRLENL